jgi:hypothetical protein
VFMAYLSRFLGKGLLFSHLIPARRRSRMTADVSVGDARDVLPSSVAPKPVSGHTRASMYGTSV